MLDRARTAVRDVPGGRDGRRMLLVQFIDKIGTGLWAAAVALYFTYVTHLGVGQIGILVGVSGALGIAGAPLAGRLADRFPVTHVLIGSQLLRAAALLALLTTHDYALLLVLSAIGALPDRASSVLNKLYAARAAGPDRVRYQAVQRTIGNLGWAVGGLGAAAALSFATAAAYQALLIANVLSYVLMAALTARCAEPQAPTRVVRTHDPKSTGAPDTRPPRPWRDRTFLLYTATEAVLFLDDAILQVGMPLWIVHATDAPVGLAPLILVLNSVLVVLFQVPFSRFGTTPAAARRLLAPLAGAYALGCLALSASTTDGRWTATAAVLLAAVALTFAEIIHATVSWELSVHLAPAEAQGAYLGVHGLAPSVQRSAGPLIVTTVIAVGAPAWPVLAAVLAATCLAQNALVRRHETATTTPLSVPPVTVSEH
ncbi:MFS transporter [Streptomyces sp. NPDC001941]|uniref:MFS transporter n=1 Tax=Streptomyces sp. NPDC001941 TaxID=3154659 RepID=UPI00332ACB5D